MPRNFLIVTLLSLIVAVLTGGCSQETPTSSDLSVLASQKLAETPAFEEVAIVYRNTSPRAEIEALGAMITGDYKYFPVMTAYVPISEIGKLRNNPNILAVERDIPREFNVQTLDWGVDRIDAEYVHAESGNRGAGVNVAVLDTGGDIDHPDLTWAGGVTMIGQDPNAWDDKYGHGTHCSGIIGANDNDIGVVGVAPECNLYMVQISRAPQISLFRIIAGIDWCVNTHFDEDQNNDIKIMSMSFSGGFSEAESTAIAAAYDVGILPVAAAGNYAGDVRYPAALQDCMAISGCNSDDGWYTSSCFGEQIELVAPAVSVLSTYKMGTYVRLTGTSMACPHVAGTAAVIWSDNPGFSNEEVRSRLNSTAEWLPALTVVQQGNGLVDVENAVLGTTNGDN